MLDKIFGKSRNKLIPEPSISFGRYSDNNKTLSQINRWKDAEMLFKEKKVYESLDAFFDYLKDPEVENVQHTRNGNEGTFSFYQGSKIVHGRYDEKTLKAEVPLAQMATPSVPVMRRLLELNFHVYYSRYGLDGDQLYMLFDTSIANASPAKLYYGLKELATRADKQDDLLVHDFTMLEMTGTDHVEQLPVNEKEIKFKFLQQWLQQAQEEIEALDMEKFSGAIAYILLSLLFRIDYLLRPEGKLLLELEKIIKVYYKKDDKPVIEKNRQMLNGLKKIKARTKEEVFPFLFNGLYTFSIVQPQSFKTISENISNANQNVAWYSKNGYPAIARQITEYGLSYSQYSYSLPRPVSELFLLFMIINHTDFFAALGFSQLYYNPHTKRFDKKAIEEKVAEIEKQWQPKYPKFKIDTEQLKYASLLQFNLSFTRAIEKLDLDN